MEGLHRSERGVLRRRRLPRWCCQARTGGQGRGSRRQCRSTRELSPMRSHRSALAARLPDFPWDTLAPATQTAAKHPEGIIDLSMGTPVDDVPTSVQQALAATANAPGYPRTEGTPQFREAVSDWLIAECGVSGCAPSSIIPTAGLKEAVASLPLLLGLGAEHSVVVPELAYPTYEVGAIAAGARVIRASSIDDWAHDESVALVWVNSPSNPTGRILAADELRATVEAARRLGAVVASDECYLDLWWSGERPVSVLSDAVCAGDHHSLLALHSLSKRSNLAGYRVGSIAGDPAIVRELLAARKHLGLIVASPNLAAATAAYLDRESVAQQRERYRQRRDLLLPALAAAGLRVEHSEGSLFLWATEGVDGWTTVDRLADLGILVAPGSFYGPAGSHHVRIALTTTDEQIANASRRLRAAQ
ncbi:MAG: succinyldiaminopimelate transaminase [Actinobacteria bacterium]|nr:succinyldiaminopimelate transaminase [Actinomycetota bacterium]